MPEKEAEPVVGVIVNVIKKQLAGSKILFLCRSGGRYEGQWWPVGGTCEPGENPLETALRELKEETNLIPMRLYRLGKDVPHSNQVSKLKGYVAYVDADAKVLLNYEHSDFKWVSVEQAIDMVPDQVHAFMQYLESHFIMGSPASEDLLWPEGKGAERK